MQESDDSEQSYLQDSEESEEEEEETQEDSELEIDAELIRLYEEARSRHQERLQVTSWHDVSPKTLFFDMLPKAQNSDLCSGAFRQECYNEKPHTHFALGLEVALNLGGLH